MKWIIKLPGKLLCILWRILGMNIPTKQVNNKTLIDDQKVKNVCLHYDGEKYYYTALVEGLLVFIAHSNELKNWIQSSGIAICDFSVIWETPIPEDKALLEYENIEKTAITSKLKK